MIPHLANTPVLETDRLILRAPIGTDWPYWSAFAQSKRAQYAGGPHTAKSAWRAFGHVVGHWVMRSYGMFIFHLKDSDIPLGSAGQWNPEGWPEREIGWTIWAPGAEGKGFAFEAASAARDHAFSTLGWKTAVSYIDAPNTRSTALANRLGAVRDATAKAPLVDRDDVNVLVYRHPRPGAA